MAHEYGTTQELIDLHNFYFNSSFVWGFKEVRTEQAWPVSIPALILWCRYATLFIYISSKLCSLVPCLCYLTYSQEFNC